MQDKGNYIIQRVKKKIGESEDKDFRIIRYHVNYIFDNNRPFRYL